MDKELFYKMDEILKRLKSIKEEQNAMSYEMYEGFKILYNYIAKIEKRLDALEIKNKQE